jgi:hypothetical protein
MQIARILHRSSPVASPVASLVAGLVAGLLVGPVAEIALGTPVALAAPRRKPPAVKPEPKTAEQKEADRHFKSGVALFKEAKYTEALAEFERAYEIAPHPLVLYNIAGCHRELSHYGEAVTYYGRFLADGKGQVPAARLTAAQTELDAILARVARVTVTTAPAADDVALILDGAPLDKPVMPLILPPGEHRLVARAKGWNDAERTLRVASGDEVTVELALALVELPPTPPERPQVIQSVAPVRSGPPARRRFRLGAGFGTNVLRAADSGAPSLGLGAAIGSRLELGVDAVLVAYAAVPSVRVRLAGDALSLHVVAAAPIAFTDGPMSTTFMAGAIGLDVRYRATPGLAFCLESYASFAGATHGTTVPTFLRGELWF